MAHGGVDPHQPEELPHTLHQKTTLEDRAGLLTTKKKEM
jgi:hypothetical protein